MNNGTCGANQAGLEEIEQIGSDTFTHTLYRRADGKYFLREETYNAFPKGKSYTLPKDAAELKKDEQRRVKTTEISEKDAMLWYVREFLNDDMLREKFTALVTADNASEPPPTNVIHVSFRSTVSARVAA